MGYATYFNPGWYVDHVIAEVWDPDENRWRLVEPEVSEAFLRDEAVGGPFDPLDVPPDRFLTGAKAWGAARPGEADPGRFVVAPDFLVPATRGWASLAYHVVPDLAALAKVEMLLWDEWGILLGSDPLAEAETLDALAEAIAAPDPAVETVLGWFRREGLMVSPEIASFSPAGGPSRVDVRRALKGILTDVDLRPAT